MNIQLVESIKQLILVLTPEEQEWLRTQLISERDPSASKTMVDLNEFSGLIQLQDDPLVFQHRMRDEWM